MTSKGFSQGKKQNKNKNKNEKPKQNKTPQKQTLSIVWLIANKITLYELGGTGVRVEGEAAEYAWSCHCVFS